MFNLLDGVTRQLNPRKLHVLRPNMLSDSLLLLLYLQSLLPFLLPPLRLAQHHHTLKHLLRGQRRDLAFATVVSIPANGLHRRVMDAQEVLKPFYSITRTMSVMV
jgi:hypothetical protein